MEIPVSNPKFSSHLRSVSFPSSSHPLIAGAEEHLHRLKSSKSQSLSSCASACHKLDGLKTLYQCLDDVLQLSMSQQAFSQETSNWEEEVLDGSLMLLDICGSIRDIFLQKKESIQELESSLRRKRGGELETYMISKRGLNKMICKCYNKLKKADKKNKGFETMSLVNLIKEIQQVSFKILDSSLSLVLSDQSRGWSAAVSKVLKHMRASGKGDSDVEKMEAELQFLNDKKSNQGDLLQMQNILKRLDALNLSIQELAEALEIVYRLLLKTRVSILNILNH